MRFLKALCWEALQNLPLFLGFLIAARLAWDSMPLALGVTLAGILLGVAIMHITEDRLQPPGFRAMLKGDLVNGAVFFALAVPFLFYFSSAAPWIGWLSDLVLGGGIGVVITLAQGLAWEGPRRRLLQHGVAMVMACPLVMLAVRGTLRIGPWPALFGVGILFTASISAVIVAIDYWPQLRSNS